MDASNCQTTIPKQALLPNQPIYCPWVSRAPITSSVSQDSKSAKVLNGENFSQIPANCQHTMRNHLSCNNHHQATSFGSANMVKLSIPPNYPSIQQSSNQFFHFLRLMQLFPDIHPATLHTVLVLCKNDFFCAVDKLLYAKRCKQMYNNQTCNNTNTKPNRFKPYCCVQPVMLNNSTASFVQNNQLSNSLGFQGFNQAAPLDASVKKMQTSNDQPSNLVNKENERVLKGKSVEPRKILPRCRARNRNRHSIINSSSNDFPSVASLQCNLPIRPLSPILGTVEDLSNQSTST